MDNDEERQATTLEGKLPPHSEKYTYDGDLNATEVIHTASNIDQHINEIALKLKTGELTVSQAHELKDKLASLITSQEI